MYGRSLDEILAAPQSNGSPKLLDVEPSYPSDPQSGFARGGHGLFFNRTGLPALCQLYLGRMHPIGGVVDFTENGRIHVAKPLIQRIIALLAWAICKPWLWL